MNSIFHRSGNITRVQDARTGEVSHKLIPSVYMVSYDERSDSFFLKDVDDFVLPDKLYGDTNDNASRIISTFEDRTISTGVLLTGEKGSGKTLLSKKVCLDMISKEYPVLLIQSPFTSETFFKFIQDVGECVIVFDEFEKVYDLEDQEGILSLFDGIITTKKLFILTCNDVSKLDPNLINRPGRMFYRFNYKGLSKEFILEYCKDYLGDDESIANQIVNVSDSFAAFNFDMLKSLIEEMLRYKEPVKVAISRLNMVPAFQRMRYAVEIFNNKGKLINPKTEKNESSLSGRNYPTHWYGDPTSSEDMVEFSIRKPDMYIGLTSKDITKADNKQVTLKCNDNDVTVVLTKKKSDFSHDYSFDFIEEAS